VVGGFGLALTVRGRAFVISLFDTKGVGFGFCIVCLIFALPLLDDVVLALAVRTVCCC